ncbi:uncharacterized protein AB675_4125 [Cyphellophora attinorum]|uniref:Uncharacterized protein n=1 Tax=Cyphellophora attinorum TaxID=1664694 RepID=A0A0N1H7G5_9EURO|nr:uncharacterized protein AB675_4125 [Phialophora attinorum]KPI38634.1 hypothetical protein AB675_4125 [Phialophora attinorum]
MVLITASTVSAVLSAGIIVAFTFLLFLAGYVLQQQSVNSLREAIRQPPPKPPKPVLPDKFRERDHDEQLAALADGNETEINEQIAQFLGQDASSDPVNTVTVDIGDGKSASQDTLAYILALTRPSDLCSAALFARSLSLTPDSSDRLVLLYPSTWESSVTDLHMSALTFMRDLHDTHPIIFHPVEFVKGWETATTHAHLLGELQRTPWDFSRMLYLKTPGMIMDADAVTEALRTSSAKKMWTPMTSAVGEDPEVLMWEKRRGLLMPRGEMRGLVGRHGSEGTLPSEHSAMTVQEEDEKAAPVNGSYQKPYVVFGHGEKGEEGDLHSQFEIGLNSVCAGRGLLLDQDDRVELRRS